MSMRSSEKVPDGWRMFSHGGRADQGLYVAVDDHPASGRVQSDCDEPNLTVNDADFQGYVQMFLPRDVCEAIAKWVATTPRWPR